MKIRKLFTSIVILLMLSMSLVAVLPAANAHSPAWDVPTYAYISASQNPVGVGQTLTISFWLNPLSPTANGIYGDNWIFTLKVTDPSGETKTIGTFTSNPTAWAFSQYTPDKVGTYTFQMLFAGQTLVNANPPPIPSVFSTSVFIGDHYQASESSVAVTVQQQAVTSLPQTPLPSNYWQRPINAQNQQWSRIAGNWLYGTYNSTSNFNPYSTGPDSPHIVWTKPLQFGGQVGGDFAGDGSTMSNYYTGKLYEGAFTPPIIINGVLYYNEGQATAPREGFYAVDLRTGETLWWKNSTGPVQIGAQTTAHIGSTDIPWQYPQLKFGQILNFYSPNQQGGIPYLWENYVSQDAATYSYTMGNGTVYSFSSPKGSNIWQMLDAFTGNYICSLANVPSGSIMYDENGNILVYTLNAAQKTLTLWNSTKALEYPHNNLEHLSTGEAFYWMWRPPVGRTVDAKYGYMWNVTQPQVYPGEVISCVSTDVLVCTNGNMQIPQNWQMEVGINAKTGEQLWIQNRSLPVGSTSYALMGIISNGVYGEFHLGSMEWYGFSAYTGEQLWGPSEQFPNPWGSQPSTPPRYETNAYGNIYQLCMDGIHAIRMSDGKVLWNFEAPSSGVETITPTYPFMQSAMVLADNKVFAASSIQYGDPLYRGAELYAINAQSGQQLWSMNGFFTSGMAVADGYLVGFNGYDNQIYCFGKGQSATSVSATPGVGNVVTLQGSVTDQSPGETCLGTPAASTPAIADEFMGDWMAYLYEQQPQPQNAKGVSLTLYATDSSGTTTNIGTTSTDIAGHYVVSWTPPSNGVYTITAAFDGTKSYFASTAETSIAVNAVSTTPTTPAASTVNAVSPEMFYAVSAILVILILVVAFLVLRKK
jgi:PQQ-like domain